MSHTTKRADTEPVKAFETTGHADLMSASGVGSLIQATVSRHPDRQGQRIVYYELFVVIDIFSRYVVGW